MECSMISARGGNFLRREIGFRFGRRRRDAELQGFLSPSFRCSVEPKCPAWAARCGCGCSAPGRRRWRALQFVERHGGQHFVECGFGAGRRRTGPGRSPVAGHGGWRCPGGYSRAHRRRRAWFFGRTMVPSMTLSSSRTLPGQRYCWRASITEAAMPVTLVWLRSFTRP